MIEKSRELVQAATIKMGRTKSEMNTASEHINAASANTRRISTLLLEFYGLWIANDADLAAAAGHVEANQALLKDIEEDLRSIGAVDDTVLGGMGTEYKESMNLTEQTVDALKAAAQSHETIASNAEDLRLASATMQDALPSPGHNVVTAFKHAEGFLKLAERLTGEDL